MLVIQALHKVTGSPVIQHTHTHEKKANKGQQRVGQAGTKQLEGRDRQRDREVERSREKEIEGSRQTEIERVERSREVERGRDEGLVQRARRKTKDTSRAETKANAG